MAHVQQKERSVNGLDHFPSVCRMKARENNTGSTSLGNKMNQVVNEQDSHTSDSIEYPFSVNNKKHSKSSPFTEI
jgi:hypothetical protein